MPSTAVSGGDAARFRRAEQHAPWLAQAPRRWHHRRSALGCDRVSALPARAARLASSGRKSSTRSGPARLTPPARRQKVWPPSLPSGRRPPAHRGPRVKRRGQKGPERAHQGRPEVAAQRWPDSVPRPCQGIPPPMAPLWLKALQARRCCVLSGSVSPPRKSGGSPSELQARPRRRTGYRGQSSPGLQSSTPAWASSRQSCFTPEGLDSVVQTPVPDSRAPDGGGGSPRAPADAQFNSGSIVRHPKAGPDPAGPAPVPKARAAAGKAIARPALHELEAGKIASQVEGRPNFITTLVWVISACPAETRPATAPDRQARRRKPPIWRSLWDSNPPHGGQGPQTRGQGHSSTASIPAACRQPRLAQSAQPPCRP